MSHEITRVGRALRLQDAVHCGDQLDELAHRPVAFLRSQGRIVLCQLDLIDERVRALLFPVIEEYVFEQVR